MASNDEWQKQTNIGTQGESEVKEYLEGRQHWSTNKPAKSFIDHESIVCKAQVWHGTQGEHIANKDYLVTVLKPCSKCEYLDCSYKNEEPYETPISEKHEVKTNIATHVGKGYSKKYTGLMLREGKRFFPTFNLFIEYWQDVPKKDVGNVKSGRLKPYDKLGWFQKEPPAWFHFYQPIEYNDFFGKSQSAIEDDSINENDPIAQTFFQDMNTNDRLILERPWGYIVSVRGDDLHRIEKCLREIDGYGKPIQATANNKDNTCSIGTLIPVVKLLNDETYYNRDGKGTVAVTLLLKTVCGKNTVDKGELHYYMPTTMHEHLHIDETKNKGKAYKVGSLDAQLRGFRNILLFTPGFNAEYKSKVNHETLKIKNGWVTMDINGKIEITYRNNPDLPVEHFEPPTEQGAITTFEVSGEGVGTFGDAYLKVIGIGQKPDDNGTQQPALIYERLDLVPNRMVLNRVKKWPGCNDIQ